MSFKFENSEGLSKIYVPGRFDFKVVAEINKYKADIPPVNKVQFDLTGCEYIDSAALGLLLDSGKKRYVQTPIERTIIEEID